MTSLRPSTSACRCDVIEAFDNPNSERRKKELDRSDRNCVLTSAVLTNIGQL